jgi:hypothetical protein
MSAGLQAKANASVGSVIGGETYVAKPPATRKVPFRYARGTGRRRTAMGPR